MTVEELLQKLVELAARGRGQWRVAVIDEFYGEPMDISLDIRDDRKEVVIE